MRILAGWSLTAGAIIGALVVGPGAVAKTVAAPPIEPGTYTRIAVPGAVTMAEGISDSGVIVGCLKRKTGPMRGFIDRHGRFTIITDPAAATSRAGITCPAGIDNAGAIVGQYRDRSGVFHGFLYQNRKFTTIDEPHAGRRSGQGTTAVEINKAGVIVGWYITSKGAVSGFILKAGVFKTVTDPAADSVGEGTVLNGIEDNGTISGLYADIHGREHGFWYRNGVFHKVDVPGAHNTEVVCISERRGLIVGSYQPRSGSAFRAFTYHHGVFRTLPKPVNSVDVFPQCGNDIGRVVGFYITDKGRTRAFRFTPAKASASISVMPSRTRPTTSALASPRSPGLGG
jgi:uncharacterized membrane protein